jgi:hypothetical protein
MKKTRLKKWAAIAEITASIAVIISLLFVGFQLHRNTTELRATHSNDLYDAIREIELAMISAPQLVDVYAKGWNGRRAEMNEEELLIFRQYLMQSFTIWEQAHARMLDGTMSMSEYQRWKDLFIVYLRQGVTRDDLDDMLPWMNEAFRSELLENSANLRE